MMVFMPLLITIFIILIIFFVARAIRSDYYREWFFIACWSFPLVPISAISSIMLFVVLVSGVIGMIQDGVSGLFAALGMSISSMFIFILFSILVIVLAVLIPVMIATWLYNRVEKTKFRRKDKPPWSARKRWIACGCIILGLLTAYIIPMIVNPIRQPRFMIENEMSKITPIGMHIDDVIIAVESHLGGTPSVQRHHRLEARTGLGRYTSPVNRLFIPIFSTEVFVIWRFNGDGYLIEVNVRKSTSIL